MLYTREIEDPVLIQFIILYTLYSSDEPLGYDDLLNVILENCNISYTDFQIALDNLITTDHVRTYRVSERRLLHEITPKGENTSDFFRQGVPIYIKEPINVAIKKLFIQKRRQNAVRSKIVPIDKDNYRAECSLYDDDKLELLELNLYAGTREDAEKMARHFKSDYQDIYQRIIMMMTEEDKPKEVIRYLDEEYEDEEDEENDENKNQTFENNTDN